MGRAVDMESASRDSYEQTRDSDHQCHRDAGSGERCAPGRVAKKQRQNTSTDAQGDNDEEQDHSKVGQRHVRSASWTTAAADRTA